MKKLRLLALMKSKENLKINKIIHELNKIKKDSDQCEKINQELGKLLDENTELNDQLGVTSFVSNRKLMHKMLNQKTVIQNRIEYLEAEKNIIQKNLSESEVKRKIFSNRKESLKTKLREERYEKIYETILKQQKIE